MNKNLYLRLIFLITFLLLGFYNSYAITVGPAKLEYKVDPGTIIEGKILLINETAYKSVFVPSFEKFIEVGGEKKFFGGEKSELTEWFKFPNEIVLEPQERKDVPFKIEVPKNAPPGGHFAVIWWGNKPVSEGGDNVSIITRAGILVYLQVSGDINESGKLLNFNLEKNRFLFWSLPTNFLVSFRNEGNTYLKPKGDITIKNIFRKDKVIFGVNEADRILLPQTEDNLRIVPKFEKVPFAFGPYKAILTLNWGDKPEVVQSSFWFFVLPIKETLLGILVIILIYFGVKRYNRWIIEKYSSK
ncbi:MAG: hypothetical protein N2Z85_03010 [Patescibacteria group bacterium]|nr:hypothetical protein [Patescibacteria group bacterium]